MSTKIIGDETNKIKSNVTRQILSISFWGQNKLELGLY